MTRYEFWVSADRSKCEIFMEALKSDDEKEREAATETLNTAAKAVGIDTAAFRNACEEIAYDPHTAFISEVWEEWRLGQEDAENGEQPAG